MSDHVIPFENLPSGFGDLVDAPPEEPAVPRPAATILLMREGPPGLEVLLLRRSRSSGFVPGAYVFPGGRVDPGDADATLFGRVDGVDEAAAAERLGSTAAAVHPLAYYVAVVREAFEETGLLLARGEGTVPERRETGPLGWTRGGAGDAVALRARDDLLEERASFAQVLERLACRVAGDAVEYIAHWITPVAEPRRYDTRFFAATVAADRDVSLDPREMIEARWLTPARALGLNREGALPMVFPTLKTLEAFRDFRSPGEALASFRGRPVHPTLPRLVRTSTGIGIELSGE